MHPLDRSLRRGDLGHRRDPLHAQVLANAILRKTLNAPIVGTLEITKFWYMTVLAIMGMLGAETRNENIRADLLFRRFPPIARSLIAVAINLHGVGPSFALTNCTLLRALDYLRSASRRVFPAC
jgi:TRAP-type C4-dicarboxylate transport system permease small subunit